MGICSSDQMPAQVGVMRPSGETASCSITTSPAPPAARAPRCIRCQSVSTPSWPSQEYIVIGDTAMRLRSVTSFRRNSVNRSGIQQTFTAGEAADAAAWRWA